MFENANFLTAIIGFILVLGPLIVVHELGHYLVGRAFGVKADAFSVGFGREIFGHTDRRGTRWKLAALPLGGYVQFAGDMNPASQPSEDYLALPEEERKQTFQARTLGQRALIVAAGPFTNFAVAVLILAGFTMAYGTLVAPPVIGGFAPDSPAVAAGLEAGDRVVMAGGEEIDDFQQLREAVLPYPGEELPVVVERDGRRLAATVDIAAHVEIDRFGNEFRMGRIGITAAGAEAVPVGPIAALGEGVSQTIAIMRMSLVGLGQIITGRRSVDELGGPIKIAKYSGEQLVSGWSAFVAFVALISINLAFINLLPIPVLDGGHLAFYAAEALRGRPVSQRGQEWAFRAGLAVVLALMVFVTVNDLTSLVQFGS